jgi:hypothetical protein
MKFGILASILLSSTAFAGDDKKLLPRLPLPPHHPLTHLASVEMLATAPLASDVNSSLEIQMEAVSAAHVLPKTTSTFLLPSGHLLDLASLLTTAELTSDANTKILMSTA